MPLLRLGSTQGFARGPAQRSLMEIDETERRVLDLIDSFSGDGEVYAKGPEVEWAFRHSFLAEYAHLMLRHSVRKLAPKAQKTFARYPGRPQDYPD